VTQTVPAVAGYSSVVIEYKEALAKYFPGESPNYNLAGGFISANVLIERAEALRPADRHREAGRYSGEHPQSRSWFGVPLVSAAASTRLRTRSGTELDKPENTSDRT